MKKLWKSVKPLIILTLLLGPVSFFIPSVKVNAQTEGMQYFGGKITAMVPCTCSSGDQLTIVLGDQSGTYLYDGAETYGSHMVMPGVWSLGGYESGGECRVGEEPYCDTLSISKGTISFIGTSYP
jgi:hypothetical protein